LLFQLVGVPAARADGSTADWAERLFRMGKDRLAQKDYARACPLLAESFRVDPATGALLALAACHEREGKLASAFREYGEAAKRSAREGRKDRELAARRSAAALAPQVPTLTIRFNGKSERVEVELDGVPVAGSLLGTALPVDGGEHVVKATFPDRRTSTTRVSLAERMDSEAILIVPLDDELPAARTAARSQRHRARAAASRGRSANVASDRGAEQHGLSGWQWTGIITLGVGVVGLGAGGFLALDAVAKNRDSEAACEGDVCTLVGKRDRQYALQSGDRATIAFAAGGALAAIGLMALSFGGSSADADESVAAAPWLDGEAGGVVVRGSL
jgi:hypothetical protein